MYYILSVEWNQPFYWLHRILPHYQPQDHNVRLLQHQMLQLISTCAIEDVFAIHRDKGSLINYDNVFLTWYAVLGQKNDILFQNCNKQLTFNNIHVHIQFNFKIPGFWVNIFWKLVVIPSKINQKYFIAIFNIYVKFFNEKFVYVW